jgi:hypothetical protein
MSTRGMDQANVFKVCTRKGAAVYEKPDCTGRYGVLLRLKMHTLVLAVKSVGRWLCLREQFQGSPEQWVQVT